MNEKRFRFTKSAVDGLAIPTKDDVGTVGYTMLGYPGNGLWLAVAPERYQDLHLPLPE
jgi:hypothetical protein